MTRPAWTWRQGQGPILAAAIHAGHDLRPEVAALTALDDQARLREEDPYTDRWTAVGDSAVVVNRSRFEVDLNRPLARAVYAQPEDCWGLQPWKAALPAAVLDRSRSLHEAFYVDLAEACDELVARHGRFVLLDLHSYNHRRMGPGRPPADPTGNPVVNVGTATVDRRVWGRLVERFVRDLTTDGWDARENVRFTGAYIAEWVHHFYPQTGCCLAIDVKKVFMDEHTGVVDDEAQRAVCDALARTVPGLLDSLG